jgi:hypothetical protein
MNNAELEKALKRAFGLGQTYWQQSDSESYAQNRKSDETLQKFRDLTASTLAALEQQEPGVCARCGGLVYDPVLAQEEQEPVAWIQPDHLQKARQAPFLCRVEPTKRLADFVPLYTHPPRRETEQETITPAELSAALGWPGGISTPVLDKGELLRMVAAHPPRREWQSLTDEEMLQCLKWNEALELFNEHRVPAELIEEGKQEGLGKGRAIEQACKERNT